MFGEAYLSVGFDRVAFGLDDAASLQYECVARYPAVQPALRVVLVRVHSDVRLKSLDREQLLKQFCNFSC